jgi:polyphenol oxidase
MARTDADSPRDEGAILCRLPGSGRALFTTRAGGNLSTLRGDHHERGRGNRDRLCKELGLKWLCASRQVHGATVQRVDSCAGVGGAALAIDADGHATTLPGIGVMVLIADCLPVALGSERAVAMLHAGWRGLREGVLEEGVRALRERGGEDPIVAVIGPGAGACCYEVGPEVHSVFSEDRREGCIDLHAIARERLLSAGVSEVRDLELCTICDERFFSHRRQGVRAGRQAGVAWLS